ncbi:MAG: flagellar biosynthetic protein FliO [Bdellovibrionaceae bacterium]|nr:flagellar biosynthetic protein FliO [Pseudobdellovibrionaceae bacterium]
MMNLLLTLIVNVFAADVNQLNAVSFEEVNKTPTLTFEFERPVSLDNVEARFIRRTVEWDLPSTKLKKDKLFINVSKSDINNVYASHNDDTSVRIRVNMDHGKMASNYHERLQYSVEGKKLTLKMDSAIPLITNNVKEISRLYSVNTTELLPEESKKAEAHIASVSTMKLDESESLAINNDAPENEIPLNTKKAAAPTSGMPSLKRIAGGFFVIAILIVSALFVTRKMKSKKAGAAFNHDSITVISQKYLGPKRNLVLIRVTGEYLLLGVTDHNISLIKNLNVVDDEIPELTGKDFTEVLEKKENTMSNYEMNRARENADRTSFSKRENDNEDSFSVSSLDDVKKIFKKKRYVDEMDQ